MKRTGPSLTKPTVHPPRQAAAGLGAGLLVLAGALAVGGCYVVPAHTAYVAPRPVYVAPAPVYVAPAPVYVVPAPGYYGGYGWRRHRW